MRNHIVFLSAVFLAACSGGSFEGGPADGGYDGAGDVTSEGNIIVVGADASASDASGDHSATNDANEAATDGDADAAVHDASSDAASPLDSGGSDTGPTCAPPNLTCLAGCVPSDEHNCGTCGHDCTNLPHVTGAVTCAAGGTCSFTASSCAPGWAHCSANPDDGCETDITQPSQCGGCGSAHVCAGGDVCTNGTCVFVVSGHAVDINSTAAQPPPLPGRQVVFLDAMGQRVEVTTDANGAFTVSGLVPPYDALVPPAPGASAPAMPELGPNAYLGLTTAHPRLGGAPIAVAARRTATLNVPVDLTACGTTGCTFGGGSAVEGSSEFTGGGFQGSYVTGQPATQTVSGTVGWSGSASTVIDISVVAFNSTKTAYWYGTAVGFAVSDQGTVTTPSITVASVPLLPPASFTVDMSQLPGWGPPTLFAGLEFGGGGWQMSFAEVKSSTVSASAPDIPGATLNLSINVGFQNAFAIATAIAPLTSTSVILQAPPSPVITSPTAGGSLSVATGQIAWTGGSSTEVFSVVPTYTPDGGQQAFEGWVWTANPSINLARLTTLGFPLTGGPTNITVEGLGKATSLDAMLDEQTLVVPDNTQDSSVTQTFTLTP
jgi:hypothetical protein